MFLKTIYTSPSSDIELKTEKEKPSRRCLCLHSPFIRRGLGSVVQGLVLHGVLVHTWHVQLKKRDATDYDSLDFCSLNFLPPPVNLSNTPITTRVWVYKCDWTMWAALLTLLDRDQCSCTLLPFNSLSVSVLAESDRRLSICCLEWECALLSEHSGRDCSKWNVKMQNEGFKYAKLTFLLHHLSDAEGWRGRCWVTIRHGWLWSRLNLQWSVLLSC